MPKSALLTSRLINLAGDLLEDFPVKESRHYYYCHVAMLMFNRFALITVSIMLFPSLSLMPNAELFYSSRMISFASEVSALCIPHFHRQLQN